MVTRTDELDVIETTVQKTYRWIRELSDELGGIGPMLIRGLYYEGWDPSRAPRKMRQAEFVETLHVTPGETADVLGILPEEIRTLLD
ncbi:MAG TPA: hypothetical protein VGR46_07340 [Candidatus Limnocylindria bacterium]|jgi:uncharacterized protein (DUF2267 family)|nr:hypothetical protein [Candidatus Limnocylindria bacterium]